jgi:hypothetical protein
MLTNTSDIHLADEVKKSNSEIKTLVGNLSKMFENMQINAVQASQPSQPRSQNPTMPNSRINGVSTGTPAYTGRYFQQNSNMSFCNYCSSQGHEYFQCHLRSLSRSPPTQNYFMPRPTFRAPFNGNRFRGAAPRDRPQTTYFSPRFQSVFKTITCQDNSDALIRKI